jgi:dolichol-phosphate mannosyltransferase
MQDEAIPGEGGSPSFAVIVPAYNEEAGIGPCVHAITDVLAARSERATLIVVDDGSGDATAARLHEQAANPLLTVVTHAVNRGYGAALKTGVLTAAGGGFDYVLFMDSDLTNDPRDIPRFVDHMHRGIDVIKASRYTAGGGFEGVPWRRRWPSIAGNLFARTLFRIPIRDCTNGFRAVKTQLLAPLDLRENGFPIIMEELYRLRPRARSFAEVPIVLKNRTGDQRVSAFRYDARTLGRYLKYPFLNVVRSIRPSREEAA